MAAENPTWGTQRIRGELMKLGIVAPWRSPSCTREPRELTPSFASHTLAAAARGAGHSVTLASAHPEHAEEAARSTGAEAAPSAAEAVRDAEIVILAIPGDSVAPVIDEVGAGLVGQDRHRRHQQDESAPDEAGGGEAVESWLIGKVLRAECRGVTTAGISTRWIEAAKSSRRLQKARGALQKEEIMEQTLKKSARTHTRRSFLLAAGAGAAGAGLLVDQLPALAKAGSTGLTPGDAAILRFLAAAEILETDVWQQYNELGGIQDSEVPGGSGSPKYTAAVNVLDADMAQYIHDNTEDEMSHFTFIDAYLAAHGAEPANLDRFRTLPSSRATGAQQIGRLTNLMQLRVDTSWWAKYRSRTKNPDFGDTFPQAVPGLSMGQFPAIPVTDGDLDPPDHLQAIANTAGFHFAFIEQGGTSLYPSLAQRVTHREVLRILLSIGPTETQHFQTWLDKAGNAPALTDPTNGLVFPDLNAPPFGGEDFQTNLIMPEPTVFLDRKFPVCSIIRPTETDGAAMGAVRALTANGLFIGQSPEFFAVLHDLAGAADAARHGS